MTAQEAITKNVKGLLHFTRRKQADLAEYLGLSQPYVSLLLNGHRQWQIDMLDRLADFFCVTVPSLLIDGEDSHERRCGVDRRLRGDRRRNGYPPQNGGL